MQLYDKYLETKLSRLFSSLLIVSLLLIALRLGIVIAIGQANGYEWRFVEVLPLLYTVEFVAENEFVMWVNSISSVSIFALFLLIFLFAILRSRKKTTKLEMDVWIVAILMQLIYFLTHIVIQLTTGNILIDSNLLLVQLPISTLAIILYYRYTKGKIFTFQ